MWYGLLMLAVLNFFQCIYMLIMALKSNLWYVNGWLRWSHNVKLCLVSILMYDIGVLLMLRVCRRLCYMWSICWKWWSINVKLPLPMYPYMNVWLANVRSPECNCWSYLVSYAIMWCVVYTWMLIVVLRVCIPQDDFDIHYIIMLTNVHTHSHLMHAYKVV